jgi:predicted nucleic acid-binding protein
VKSLYLDTNVFLAVHSPGDRGHGGSVTLLTAVEEGQAKAVTSTLTLIEIASAVKRSSNKFAKNGSDQELPGSFVRRALRTKNLEYVGLGAEIPLGQEARVPSVYAIALKAVRTLPLKTLDLLHIASAYAAIRLHGRQLDYFTTLDEGILDHRKEVKTFLGCPSATPGEVVTLEGF